MSSGLRAGHAFIPLYRGQGSLECGCKGHAASCGNASLRKEGFLQGVSQGAFELGFST